MNETEFLPEYQRVQQTKHANRGLSHILTTNDDGSLKRMDGVTEMKKHWYVLQHIGESGVTIGAYNIIRGIVPNPVSSSLHKLFSELKINVPLNSPL
jgi:hypothetical protein